MIFHQTFLHLGTDRDMAGWHSSTGHMPKMHCWCLSPNSPTVCCIGATPLGVIYVQHRIDGLSVFTPLFTPNCKHFSDAHMDRVKCGCCCKVLPMVCFCRSLSYVLCMGCFSFLLLGGMYFVTDIKGWWSGQPFIYPGTVYTRTKTLTAL